MRLHTHLISSQWKHLLLVHPARVNQASWSKKGRRTSPAHQTGSWVWRWATFWLLFLTFPAIHQTAQLLFSMTLDSFLFWYIFFSLFVYSFDRFSGWLLGSTEVCPGQSKQPRQAFLRCWEFTSLHLIFPLRLISQQNFYVFADVSSANFRHVSKFLTAVSAFFICLVCSPLNYDL